MMRHTEPCPDETTARRRSGSRSQARAALSDPAKIRRASEWRAALGWIVRSWFRPAGSEARWEQKPPKAGGTRPRPLSRLRPGH